MRNEHEGRPSLSKELRTSMDTKTKPSPNEPTKIPRFFTKVTKCFSGHFISTLSGALRCPNKSWCSTSGTLGVSRFLGNFRKIRRHMHVYLTERNFVEVDSSVPQVRVTAPGAIQRTFLSSQSPNTPFRMNGRG